MDNFQHRWSIQGRPRHYGLVIPNPTRRVRPKLPLPRCGAPLQRRVILSPYPRYRTRRVRQSLPQVEIPCSSEAQVIREAKQVSTSQTQLSILLSRLWRAPSAARHTFPIPPVPHPQGATKPTTGRNPLLKRSAGDSRGKAGFDIPDAAFNFIVQVVAHPFRGAAYFPPYPRIPSDARFIFSRTTPHLPTIIQFKA